ncbi:Thiamine phosphate synthase [Lentibacillus sp. JNUCC-1]|uniref:ADP-ribosylglycohydrolase family protein n=1 Tax=Lentibacillus sp. JNUCC-1 TaxID=2654513 RepID=UPI0012E8B12A|nr:ADP-ribosylglycohydrolase family protein [Lentibacillus sp. JNUCC-1]MUV37637.1 Thiamine phosphate synthase [Lentibacillus sp. JNUCC-1]
MADHILNGIMGLTVADALGVPVEFESRESLDRDPVVGFRAYGTYNQPAGTWSDDTSLTLCLADSLSKGVNYDLAMKNFASWYNDGAYTPFGIAFDIGISTREAIARYENGTPPLECGGASEYDNGNGSLMRILPILFYLEATYGKDFMKTDGAFNIIHHISALTHAHPRSQIACGIYIAIASKLKEASDVPTAVSEGIRQARSYYQKQARFADELTHFNRLEEDRFAEQPRQAIKSSGYVVDTLEAAVWCLLQTDSYQACVLKAVNLGEDTDTVAAVAGGLAGLYYGYENIPQEWLESLVEQAYVESFCHQLSTAMTAIEVGKLTAYIPYFETVDPEKVAHWEGGQQLGEKGFSMPYPTYDPTLKQFINTFSATTLMHPNYIDITRQLPTQDKVQAIDSADFEQLRAILTGYVRQERFNEGTWAQAVADNVFLKILKRLREIDHEWK